MLAALSNKYKRLLYSITGMFILAYALGSKVPFRTWDPSVEQAIVNMGFARIIAWGIGTDLIATLGLILFLFSVGVFVADIPRLRTNHKVQDAYKRITQKDIYYFQQTYPKVLAKFVNHFGDLPRAMVEISDPGKYHPRVLRSWESHLEVESSLTFEDLVKDLEVSPKQEIASTFILDLRDPQTVPMLVVAVAFIILAANIVQHPEIYIPLLLLVGVITYIEVSHRKLARVDAKKGKTLKTRITWYVGITIGFLIVGRLVTTVLSSPLILPTAVVPSSLQEPPVGSDSEVSNDASNNMAVVDIPLPVKEVPLGQPVPEVHISALNDYKPELLNVAESLRVSLEGLNASKTVVTQNNATFLGMHEMIEGTTGFNGLNVVHSDLNCWYKQGSCTMSDGTVMPLDTYSSRVMIATSNGSLSPEEGALLLASGDAAYNAYDAFYVLANKLYAAAYYDKLAKDPTNGLSKEDRASNQALADQAYVEAFVLEAQLNLRLDQLNVFAGQLGVAPYPKIDGVVDFLKKAAENNRAAPLEVTATPNPNVVAVDPNAILSGAAFTATPDPMNGPLVSSTAVCNRSDGFYNPAFSGWYAASTAFNASISYATYAPCGGIEASQYRVDIYLSNGSHFWIFSADVPSNIVPGQKFLVVPGPEAGGVLNITCKEQGLPLGACPVAQIVP